MEDTCDITAKYNERIEKLERENFDMSDALEAIAMYVYEEAPEEPATPDDVQQKVLEYINELTQLHEAKCNKLHGRVASLRQTLIHTKAMADAGSYSSSISSFIRKAPCFTNTGNPEANVIAAAKAWAEKWRPGPNAQVEEDGCPIGMNRVAWERHVLIQAVERMNIIQKEARS